jgi:hypothetical protein
MWLSGSRKQSLREDSLRHSSTCTLPMLRPEKKCSQAYGQFNDYENPKALVRSAVELGLTAQQQGRCSSYAAEPYLRYCHEHSSSRGVVAISLFDFVPMREIASLRSQ